MTSALDATFNFTDLQGLAALGRQGTTDSPDARRAVAQQFEALFLNMMLKEMRAATAVDGGLFDDNGQMGLRESMLDQQLALTLARGSGTGLAQSILRSLGEPTSSPGDAAAKVSALPQRPGPVTAPIGLKPGARAGSSASVASAGSDAAASSETPQTSALSAAGFTPDSPEAFVTALWPHAETAARELGTSPDVLVAQAALETGWGRSQIRDADGRPSFNIFGVKASAGWSGPRAVVPTVEFQGGLPQPRREPFRMYSSLAASFDDYVALIKNPRYADAVDAATPEGYVRGLQSAGYATDPQYADKIMAILARGLPGRADQVRAPPADTLTSMADIQASAGRVEL